MDVLGEVEHFVRISPLIVIPGHEFDESVVERHAGLCVEYAGARIGFEIGGDDVLIDETDDPLIRALRGGLHNVAYLLI